MEPSAPFRALQLRGPWTPMDAACLLYAQRTAIARGQPYAAGILQCAALCLALLRTAPFRDCPATHLLDLRYGVRRVLWPERRRLLWSLWHALLVFETGHVKAELAGLNREHIRLHREEVLLESKIGYIESELQRCQAGTPAPPKGYASNLAAFDRVRRLQTRLAAMAHNPPTVASLARSLVSAMQTLAPGNYPRQAMYFAVAAICQDFGLLDRDTPLSTAADRVYQAVRPPRQRR